MKADPDAFLGHLKGFQERAELAMAACLSEPDGSDAARLIEAMRYSVLGPGKRVRPALVYGAGEAVGADPGELDSPACAVELIHAYSLIHDDLPAMDDDDLRRGRPSCHRAFDEATAILAGDALQAHAFGRLASAESAVPPRRRLEMVATLARAAGLSGMVRGQAMDLAAVGQPDLSLETLESMHRHKTGALIAASVRLGALAAPAGSDEEALARKLTGLQRYGTALGLAFQVQDDILDVTGSTEVMGKTSGADAERDKPTYVSLLGLEAARARVHALADEAVASLEPLGEGAWFLAALARYVVERDR